MPTKTVNSVTATLPNSVEAEQNVLCCIMRNQDIQLEIIAQLDESDFYQQNHAIIFAAMQQISVQSHKVGDADQIDTVNFATVIDCLRRNGKLYRPHHAIERPTSRHVQLRRIRCYRKALFHNAQAN